MARTATSRFPCGLYNSVRLTYVNNGVVVDVNASNDCIDLPGLTTNPNSNWTLPLLLYPLHDGILYNQNIYSQLDGTGTGRGYVSSPLVGQFYSCALGGVTRNSTQRPVLNAWQWFILTNSYAGGSNTNTLNMYFKLFGETTVQNVGTFSGITYENADGAHRIGASKATPTRCYDGYVSAFRFFTETFTENQINTMCSTNSFSRTNLAKEILMTETSGTTLADTSSNTTDATLTNGAVMEISIVPVPARTPVTRTPVTRTPA